MGDARGSPNLVDESADGGALIGQAGSLELPRQVLQIAGAEISRDAGEVVRRAGKADEIAERGEGFDLRDAFLRPGEIVSEQAGQGFLADRRRERVEMDRVEIGNLAVAGGSPKGSYRGSYQGG